MFARNPRSRTSSKPSLVVAAAPLALLLGGVLSAQPGASTDGETKKTEAPAELRPRTLLMIVRVGSNLTPDRIEQTLKQGLKLANCKGDAPKVESIPGTLFRLLSRDPSSSVTELEGGDKNELTIRSMPEFPSTWMLRVVGTLKEIQEVEVEYSRTAKDAQGEPGSGKTVYKPGDLSKDPDAPFYQMSASPVTYQLRFAEDVIPIKATVTTREYKAK